MRDLNIEKTSISKSNLIDINWEFKKYVNLEIGVPILKSTDEIIESLNIVKDFYLTESFLNIVKKENGLNELEAKISNISEFHDTLLKLEFIIVYKLMIFLETVDSEDKYIKWFDILDLLKIMIDEGFFEEAFGEDSSDSVLCQFMIINIGEKYNSKEFLIDSLNVDLYHLTKKLCHVFSQRINRIKKSILVSDLHSMLCFVSIRKTRVFDKKFPQRIKKRLIAYGKTNSGTGIYEKAFEDNRNNCYSTIEFEGKKYIAVNGINLQKANREKILEHFKTVLQELGKGNIEITDISDDVRYYLDDKYKYIDYRNFSQWKSDNKNENKNSFNRMFTCCERKLLAKVREIKGKEIKNIDSKKLIRLATTKCPCELCKREIKVNSNIIRVFSLDNRQENLPLTKYDQIAEEIFYSKL